MKSRTIHARVEDQTFAELEFLKKDLGMAETTKVVSFALHYLFNERKRQRAKKSPFEVMEEFELIGSFEGPENLSESYKTVLTKSLQKKHSLKKVRDEK